MRQVLDIAAQRLADPTVITHRRAPGCVLVASYGGCWGPLAAWACAWGLSGAGLLAVLSSRQPGVGAGAITANCGQGAMPLT